MAKFKIPKFRYLFQDISGGVVACTLKPKDKCCEWREGGDYTAIKLGKENPNWRDTLIDLDNDDYEFEDGILRRIENGNKFNVEKQWQTNSGLQSVVVMTEMGHRCGYVGVNEKSNLFGLNYFDLENTINVHGGLTYSGKSDNNYPIESKLWWFGFDCAHYGDDEDGGQSLRYCIDQCEMMADQLLKMENKMTLQKIEFEYDVPDGYRFVKFDKPKEGDFYMEDGAMHTAEYSEFLIKRLIVEKIPEQPKRKHADLIHAWADGAEIQYFDSQNWNDVKIITSFSDSVQYRIKPKTKTVRFRNYITYSGHIMAVTDNETAISFKKWLGDWQEVEIEE